MKMLRVKLPPKMTGRSVSRRDVLSRGAQALSVLALPNLVIRKAWGATSAGFDFYISPTGSDSHAGTLSSPWAITSLQDTNPNNAKMAGKRIGLMAGTYNCAGMRSGSSPGDYTFCVLATPS